MIRDELDDFSRDLLEREKSFRLKNKQITSKVTQALQNVESVVKEGKQNLERPKTAPKIEIDFELKKRPSTASISKQRTLVDFGSELPNVSEESLGTEATTRFLKAKLIVVQQELDRLTTTTITSLQEKLKLNEMDRQKDLKKIAALETSSERLQKQNTGLQEELIACKTEISNLNRQASQSSRQTKSSEQDVHAKDIKLNRLADEVERLRNSMNLMEADFKEKLQVGKQTAEELFCDNKRLQKQKSDLILGLKKQNQLIEVLKRQKVICS
ncbi:Golgin sub A member 2 [Terramyces sp. JEL0728]|nr:Golgin sub A member 2 [Terramyces sp. JEL0728]KAJ3273662.1 Golgin sub A member 2 [Terramyces sp. JEL0728]